MESMINYGKRSKSWTVLLRSKRWMSDCWKHWNSSWSVILWLLFIHRDGELCSYNFVKFGVFGSLTVLYWLLGWVLGLVYWTVGFFKGLSPCINFFGMMWVWWCKGLKLPFFPHQISLWTNFRTCKGFWGKVGSFMRIKKWFGSWLWIGWSR